jgi:putative PIG3 family NAD(P)H quinone oxidoreductase
MATMRAVCIKDGKGPVENLYIGEISKPTPKPGEVLVQVKAFGLNRMDIMQREGNYPVPPSAPPTLGVEFSGPITATGSEVTDWKVGDEVMGLASGGAYAEYIVLPATHIMKKPSALTWVQAASIPEVYITAYMALIRYGQVKANEDVMVHAAASGVGIAALELAKFWKARNILATTSTQDKIDFVLANTGATHGINYKAQDFASEALKITEKKGVDVIIDFVGASHWNQNIQSLALDGRMTMLATLGGAVVPEINLGPILYKRLKIQGSTLRSRSISYQADLIAEFARDVLPHISGSDQGGPLRTHIHKVYPWTEIQDAQRCMAANTNIGKIIAEVV